MTASLLHRAIIRIATLASIGPRSPRSRSTPTRRLWCLPVYCFRLLVARQHRDSSMSDETTGPPGLFPGTSPATGATSDSRKGGKGTSIAQSGNQFPQTVQEADVVNQSEARGDPEAGTTPRVTRWSTVRRIWNWKPKPARYDARNPPKFTIWLNMLFGFVSLMPSTCPQ